MRIVDKEESFKRQLIKYDIIEQANRWREYFPKLKEYPLSKAVKLAVVETFENMARNYYRISRTILVLFFIYFIVYCFFKFILPLTMMDVFSEPIFNFVSIIIGVITALQIKDYIKMRGELRDYWEILLNENRKKLFRFGLNINEVELYKYLEIDTYGLTGKIRYKINSPYYDKYFGSDKNTKKE
jgi:hypothetical protein